jgi:hypothetical protein
VKGKVMKKTINSCGDCVNYRNWIAQEKLCCILVKDEKGMPKAFGKSAEKEHINIKFPPIPEWCPLEDGEE